MTIWQKCTSAGEQVASDAYVCSSQLKSRLSDNSIPTGCELCTEANKFAGLRRSYDRLPTNRGGYLCKSRLNQKHDSMSDAK